MWSSVFDPTNQTHNQWTSTLLMYESMNQSRSQYFPTWLPFLSPRVLIIYAWIIAVNVFAYSITFSQSTSLYITVTVYCNSGLNIDFTLKNHCLTRPLFYFFGVAVRFDWIKIDIWLKLGVLNYSSRPKLSLGSAHVKYGVWPGP